MNIGATIEPKSVIAIPVRLEAMQFRRSKATRSLRKTLLFEMLEREGWTYERRRRHIIELARGNEHGP